MEMELEMELELEMEMEPSRVFPQLTRESLSMKMCQKNN